ncbi:ficolin-1-like [Musca vetustissima]|uniref:ficolin-1-like n=1 Tax=Musca vetustissima TaxID=27455 RepID=UPI002AB5EC51|nr:ficolin-1-like [Musca vetustissima]
MLYFILVLGFFAATAGGITTPPTVGTEDTISFNPEYETMQQRNELLKRHLDLMNFTFNINHLKFEKKLQKLFTELEMTNEITELNENEPQQSMSKNTISDAEKIYFTDIGEEDEPKVCKSSNGTQLVCTKLSLAESCADSNELNCRDGLCRIKNHIYGPKSFWVLCDGDWTIVQRRINGTVEFQRKWLDYKTGFGNLHGEFWLGLDKIHSLTALYGGVELKIEMQDFDNVWRYVHYKSISVGNETTKYKLSVGDYSQSAAGNSLSIHNGQYFSTIDQDNDKDSSKNCASTLMGAWWHYTYNMGYVERQLH